MPDPPKDGITSVRFGWTTDRVLASSWDTYLHLYDAGSNSKMLSIELGAPVMDCAFGTNDTVSFSGGMDQTICMHNLETNQSQELGVHSDTIRCVNFSPLTGCVYTGGWDGMLKAWDLRGGASAAGAGAQESKYGVAATLTHEGAKIYTMDIHEYKIIVGMSQRLIHVYDIRDLSKPEQIRESSLLNQTRSIRFHPNGETFGLTAVEGRVAIEIMDPSQEAQANKYAFKCHRKVVNGEQLLYPVNAIAYHPVYGTFATGGCDGLVNTWDGVMKKRLATFPSFDNSIAGLAFNRTGELLAVAASYTWEEGEKDERPADELYVVRPNESTVRPKVAANK